MLTAVIIAEFRSLPVTDIFSFVNQTDTLFLNGRGSLSKKFDKETTRHILLVDDTMGEGTTMKNAVGFIRDHYPIKDL